MKLRGELKSFLYDEPRDWQSPETPTTQSFACSVAKESVNLYKRYRTSRTVIFDKLAIGRAGTKKVQEKSRIRYSSYKIFIYPLAGKQGPVSFMTVLSEVIVWEQ